MTTGKDVWRSLSALRAARPLVHNITNYVAMDLAANVLLAAGASPIMAHAPQEIERMVSIVSALTINIGTLDERWIGSMQQAAETAQRLGKPWVLDPVGVGATPYRDATATALLAFRPTIVRGNASEILALSGASGATRGVDSAKASNEALEAARQLAQQTGAIIAVTGAVDYVTDGARLASVHNGHALMGTVTATGCALTALMGAFVAVAPAFEAALHALAYYGVAGELAATQAQGPGSFRVAFLDQLHGIAEEQLQACKLHDTL